jgi:hypothetical protein
LVAVIGVAEPPAGNVTDGLADVAAALAGWPQPSRLDGPPNRLTLVK